MKKFIGAIVSVFSVAAIVFFSFGTLANIYSIVVSIVHDYNFKAAGVGLIFCLAMVLVSRLGLRWGKSLWRQSQSDSQVTFATAVEDEQDPEYWNKLAGLQLQKLGNYKMSP
jgi:hypothetical protein